MSSRSQYRKFSLVLAVAFMGSLAQAESDLDFSAVEATAPEYYTITEETSARTTFGNDTTNLSPFSTMPFSEIVVSARAVVLSLLNWTLHSEALLPPADRYRRQFHFGRWINDPDDETCFNTRAKVLIRDSEAPVSFKEKNHCLVEKGRWADPYTGSNLDESAQIQIDHMVPLKNAYVSGASEWDYQTRCHYANYMGNTFHLISASGRENMRKGDASPARYIPPNQAYRCQYLENWLKIKLIWKLKMVPAEVAAIRQGIIENACSPENFQLSPAELRQQRHLIYDGTDVCPAR